MTVGAAGVFAALLLGVAVLLWPRRPSARSRLAGLRASGASEPGPTAARGHGDGSGGVSSSMWQRDPVDLYRQWRLRRRPGALVDDVLDLLRGIGPALSAGLTPTRAMELAATSTLGVDRVRHARESTRRRSRRTDRPSRRSRRSHRSRGWTPWRPAADPAPSGSAADAELTLPRADIDRLVGALLEASDRAEPTSPVWAAWAERSASAELAFVAAAWRLSETTGAPLASAVDRAVRGLLDARARRGKVAVAVAGPRATVTVLTLLPLTGPLFGLACGIDPVTLYLGSPIATACAALGLVLVWAGRLWCTRMVRRAVRP
jgi:tight adherence protein B